MIMLLTSFSFFYTCALFQGGATNQGLGITVFDVHSQFIKGVTVDLIDREGNKHHAKYDKDRTAYFFEQDFKEGILQLNHKKYLPEEYSLKDLIQYGSLPLPPLYLRTTDQSYFTSQGIRYPFKLLPNRIVLRERRGQNGKEKENLLKVIEVLNQMGVYYDEGFAKEALKALGPQAQFETFVFQIPEAMEDAHQQEVLAFLEKSDHLIRSGTLLGYSTLLLRDFDVVLQNATDLEKGKKLLQEMKINILSEKEENAQLKVQIRTLSTKKILDTIKELNATGLFYPIAPNYIATLKFGS